MTAPTGTPRAENRRAQIRDAAARCFAEQGFHGTSIAQISKVCGMSTGHIYHYFENKEAIIQAIVTDKVHRMVMNSEQARATPDVLKTILDGVPEGVQNNLHSADTALHLEILAEASRNPAVRLIVQQEDHAIRQALSQTISAARAAQGHQDDPETTDALTTAMAVMFEGLRVRSVRNPNVDQDALTRVFQHLITQLLTIAPPGARQGHSLKQDSAAS